MRVNITSTTLATIWLKLVRLQQTCVRFCRSFQLLDDIVDMAQQGDGTARERVPGCLQFTLAHITSFENCILTSLGFEPVLAT